MTISQQERLTVINLISTDYLYIAFFTNYDTPTGQELMTSRNKLAKVSITKQIVLGKLVVNYSLSTSQALCPNTTVVSDSGNSLTQVKLASTTGFFVDDRVSIGSNADRKILTINTATNIITVDSLLSIPTATTPVKIKISQRAIIRGGDSTLATGEIAVIEPYIIYKDSTMSLPGIMTGVLN